MVLYLPGNPNLIMFLAGNKADLQEKREVGFEVLGMIITLIFIFSLNTRVQSF